LSHKGEAATICRCGDTFFFVPMKLWGPVLCAIAVITFAYCAVAAAVV